MQAEAQRILGLIKPGEFVAALDERGTQLTTRELSTWLSGRMNDGSDLVLVIGGPDGLGSEVLARADQRLSLSRPDATSSPGAGGAGRTAVPRPHRSEWTSLPSRLTLIRCLSLPCCVWPPRPLAGGSS